MLISIPIANLPNHAHGRTPDFLPAVRAAGRINGDVLELESEIWSALARQHRIPPSAIASEILHQRTAACSGCEWHATRAHAPRCEHPSRKCSKINFHSPRENCPVGKWPAQSKTPMENKSHLARLVSRQSSLKQRAQQEHNAIVLVEARLSALRQRYQSTLGELKAIQELVDEDSASSAVSAGDRTPAAIQSA
jgi:hypothetical protein